MRLQSDRSDEESSGGDGGGHDGDSECTVSLRIGTLTILITCCLIRGRRNISAATGISLVLSPFLGSCLNLIAGSVIFLLSALAENLELSSDWKHGLDDELAGILASTSVNVSLDSLNDRGISCGAGVTLDAAGRVLNVLTIESLVDGLAVILGGVLDLGLSDRHTSVGSGEKSSDSNSRSHSV